MNHDISIIIPVRDEEGPIAHLIDTIARQEGIHPFLTLVDGSSRDSTVSVARREAMARNLDLTVVTAPANRAIQITRGIDLARSDYTAIIHADSAFDDPRAVEKSLLMLHRESFGGNSPVGGRFRLRFAERGLLPGCAVAFHEAKARLPRHDCIHGDQGMILPTRWLKKRADLPADRPMLAETILANRMLEEGTMLLFEHHIITSARRFLKEGFRERQILNALILNAHHAGWDGFFRRNLPLYRDHAAAERLDAGRIVAHAVRLLEEESPERAASIRKRTGDYVARNAWQAALFLDVLTSLSQPPRRFPFLRLHDLFLSRLLRKRSAGAVAFLLVRIWIHAQLGRFSPP